MFSENYVKYVQIYMQFTFQINFILTNMGFLKEKCRNKLIDHIKCDFYSSNKKTECQTI